jgi:hypothetical protein
LDVSDKLEGGVEDPTTSVDSKTKHKVLKKVDKWCDTVFNHVSINGLCLIAFAGPKTLDNVKNNESINSDETNKTGSSNISDSVSVSNQSKDSILTSPSSSSSKSSKSTEAAAMSSEIKSVEINTPSPPVPRRNGVCFIQLNTQKV